MAPLQLRTDGASGESADEARNIDLVLIKRKLLRPRKRTITRISRAVALHKSDRPCFGCILLMASCFDVVREPRRQCQSLRMPSCFQAAEHTIYIFTPKILALTRKRDEKTERIKIVGEGYGGGCKTPEGSTQTLLSSTAQGHLTKREKAIGRRFAGIAMHQRLF